MSRHLALKRNQFRRSAKMIDRRSELVSLTYHLTQFLCAEDLYDIDYETIFGKRRNQTVVEIRTILAKVFYELYYTYQDIGEVLNRDHATIIYLVTQYEHKANTSIVVKQRFKLTLAEAKKFLHRKINNK